METRKMIYCIEKYAIYALLMLVFYILQEIPSITLLGVRSSPIIGLFIAIAMSENEFVGGLYGLAAGILCDTAAAHTFGLASMLFLVLGCAAGLCVMYFFNSCPRSAICLAFVAAGMYNLLSYYALYGIWDYEGATRYLLPGVLPSTVVSALWGLAFFFAVRFIRDKFAEKIEN